MALANFDDLVKSIISWGVRRDKQDLIPDYILLAETEMYNNEATQLTIRDMETISVLLTTSKLISLPAGFEKGRSFQLETGNGIFDVKFQVPEQLVREISPGRPQFYTVIGDQIEFNRTPDAEYNLTIQYYKRPNALTKTNQTNSVMTKHPNIYLYGALHQLFLRSQNTEQSVLFFSKMQAAIQGANKAAKKGRYGPAPYMRIESFIP